MKINIIPKYISHTDFVFYTNKNEITKIFKQDNLPVRTCGIYINEKLTFQLPGEEIVHNIQNLMSIFLIRYNDRCIIINIKSDNESDIESISQWYSIEDQLTEGERREFLEIIDLIDINNKTLIWLLTLFKNNYLNDGYFKLTNFKIESFLKIKDIRG